MSLEKSKSLRFSKLGSRAARLEPTLIAKAAPRRGFAAYLADDPTIESGGDNTFPMELCDEGNTDYAENLGTGKRDLLDPSPPYHLTSGGDGDDLDLPRAAVQ